MNGFKAWCKTDGLNCGFWTSQGVFPSSLIALKNCIGWSAWHNHDDNLVCINGKAYDKPSNSKPTSKVSAGKQVRRGNTFL